MKRNLLTLMALSGVALSAQAAIPITSYESTAVEIPQEYAVQGGYWGISLGYNQIGDDDYGPALVADASFTNLIPLPEDLTVINAAGFSVGLTTGYRIYRWRFELEATYRTNKADQIMGLPTSASIPPLPAGTDVSNVSNVGAQGNTVAVSLLGNILYDRYYQSGWMWTLGAGIGGAYVDYGATWIGVNSASKLDFRNNSKNFAFQLIAGIGYTWNDNIETAITYRFFMPLKNTYDIQNDFLNKVTIEFSPSYFANMLNFEIRFT